MPLRRSKQVTTAAGHGPRERSASRTPPTYEGVGRMMMIRMLSDDRSMNLESEGFREEVPYLHRSPHVARPILDHLHQLPTPIPVSSHDPSPCDQAQSVQSLKWNL